MVQPHPDLDCLGGCRHRERRGAGVRFVKGTVLPLPGAHDVCAQMLSAQAKDWTLRF